MVFQMVKCTVFRESKIKAERKSKSKTGMKREVGLIYVKAQRLKKKKSETKTQ